MSRRQPSGNRQLTDPAHAGETRCPAPATPRHGTRSPHSPSPVGAVAAKEARPHLGTNLVILPASLAAGPCQPGIKATPRHRARIVDLSWRTFEVPEYGTRIDYPSGLMVPTRAPKK